MTSLLIPCPKCGKALRLRDRSMLGRKGRCPDCQQTFVLEEPAEVELELADAPASGVPSEPAMGTSAKWVPDEAPAPSVANTSQAAPADPPKTEFAGVNAATTSAGGVARLNELRRKNTKRRNVSIVAGAVTALAVAAVIFGVQPYLSSNEKNGRGKPPQVDKQRVATTKSLEENTQFLKSTSPTKGDPIELLYVPAGARFIFNIRPAELWKQGSPGEEIRFCLGPLGVWAENKLKEICRREPSQIEEALICLIPGQKGTPPEFAAVVHLVEEAKKSDLIGEFQGDRTEDYGYPVYLSEQHACLIKDLKTFAIGPRDCAEEMVSAMTSPNPTASGIEELIFHTDRDRHLTVMFEPIDAGTFEEELFPEEVLPFFQEFLIRFNNEEVETVAWSLHVGEKQFHSEILLRNTTNFRPARLHREMKKKIDDLPLQLLRAVEKMNPTEAGRRKLIGRFPAMMQVFSMATIGGIGEKGDRFVKLVSSLNTNRAAPNLAIGALLAWDESRRTDFSSPSPAPGKGKPSQKLPDLIADRLKMKFDVEFSRTPLQEAFGYIAGEAKVKIDIDGDALKLSGYTKNMPQTFKLGTASGLSAIHEILKKYDKMCIVVDEQKKVVTVMTKTVAESQGLKPFPVKP